LVLCEVIHKDLANGLSKDVSQAKQQAKPED
jgi:hypothetical protein